MTGVRRDLATEPLTASEAILWMIERDPILRSTIVVVAELDRAPDGAELRRRLSDAAGRFPRLRQRVVETRSGALRWLEVDRFAVEQHLRTIRLPGPEQGSMRAVLDLAGPLAGGAFDRARPLWDLTVVEGIGADGTGAALIVKMHHAVTDGVGGLDLLRLLEDAPADLSPERAPSPPPRDVGSPSRLTTAVRMARSVSTMALRPDRVVVAAPAVARSVAKLLAPSATPLSPLTARRGLDRRLDVLDVAMDALAAAGHAVGGTVNDAFLAAVVGGLQHYHAHLGVPLSRLRVTMPISTRRAIDRQGGNRFTPARFSVPADIAEAASRMRALGAIAHQWRREPAVGLSEALAGGLRRLPAAVTTSLFGSMLKGVDLVATNVPGRSGRTRLAGAEIVRLYGFGPPSGAAVSFALVSHGTTGCIGLNVDIDAFDDPELLTRCVRQAFDEVLAVGADAASRGRGVTPPAARAGSEPGGAPDHLSALDASFLELETPTTPMHIGALVRFEGDGLLDERGTLRLDAIRAELGDRLDRCPRLRQRLVGVPFDVGRPVWEDDPSFSIDRHVRAAAVAAPGGERELLARCAELQATPLDRAHPLWEMTFVTGLADGGVALVYKVHHAVVDGVSAAATFERLLVGPPDAPSPGPRPADHHAPLDLVADAVRARVSDAASVLRDLARSATHPDRAVAVAAGLTTTGTTLAPRCSLNVGHVGMHRLLRPVRCDVDRMKRIAHRHGATVNDVALAAVSRGVRDLLLARGEQIPETLLALVPVSVRAPGRAFEGGNQVAMLLVHLPIGERTASRRLAAVRDETRRLKSGPQAGAFGSLLGWADALPPPVTAVASRLLQHQPFVNLVITNVAATSDTLSLLGSPITEIVPVVPLASNLTLGVAILSYAGRLVIALHADADACADVDVAAAGVASELRSLARAPALSAHG